MSLPAASRERHARQFRWVLLALLLLGAGLRLFDLTDQPIDFHPTRQLRGAIIARGMYYEMLPAVATTPVDPALRQQALAFWNSTGQYEPSILERLCALTYLVIGREVVWVARIYNTIFWLIGGLALFALLRRMGQENNSVVFSADGDPSAEKTTKKNIVALAVLAFYLALPFSVQASRSFQPDPAMVMWMALAAWALYRWSETAEDGMVSPAARRASWRQALLAGLFSGLALLTKAVSAFTLAGGIMALVFYTYCLGRERPFYRPVVRMLTSPQVWLMAGLALAPTAVYYLTRQERAGEYFLSWTVELSHLLLNPRFYLGWLGLVAELVTPVALLLALAGIWLARGRARGLLVGLWLGYIAYGLFLPYQMDTHSYYHLQMVWLAALSLGPALRVLIGWLRNWPAAWRWAALGVGLLVLALGAWQALVPLYGQDYRSEPAYWQEIASYLPDDGKIVGLTQDYGYRLMYYGWRKVIPWKNRGEFKLNELRGREKEFATYFARQTAGKSYFLITAFRQYQDQPDLQEMLTQHYSLIAQGQGYLIFDLTRTK